MTTQYQKQTKKQVNISHILKDAVGFKFIVFCEHNFGGQYLVLGHRYAGINKIVNLSKYSWLPKLHKRPYKSRFIANSSACTTTELSILLTSCPNAIKNHVIIYCTTVYERNGKNLFWSIRNSGEILNKLKSIGFLLSGLSTYDFSTLYTTLHHNLIKEKLTELIEQTFNREGSLYLACNDKNAFFYF